MRRGIATFGFLARLAPVALGLGLLAGYVVLRPAAPFCECEAPPPAPMVPSSPTPPSPVSPAVARTFRHAGPARRAEGLTLAPQDLTGAWLTNCRLVGDWRGRSLRGAMLAECDLSGAIFVRAYRADRGACTYNPELHRLYWEQQRTDLRGCTYDAFTRWPAGFDPKAAGARLDE